MTRINWIVLLSFLCLGYTSTEAQILERIKDRVKKTAEDRTVDESGEKTDDVLDEVFDKKHNKKKKKKKGKRKSDRNDDGSDSGNKSKTSKSSNKELSIYRNFNFVAGSQVIVFDDFSDSHVGDFPNRWNTNSSGEVVTLNGEKWFELNAKGTYVPDLPGPLPDEYTVEFDLETEGIDDQTSSQAWFNIHFNGSPSLKQNPRWAKISLTPCQYGAQDIWVRNGGLSNQLNNPISADIRKVMVANPHVSIAVNKKRVRLWLNEEKVLDIPRLLDEGKTPYLQFSTFGFKDNDEYMFIRNLKIAKGGMDYRNDLLTKGSFSTTGILFDSGSANIKGESYGTLQMIADVLQDDTSINIEIIGHTDSDGDDASNLALSKKRAEAVKSALSKEFGVSDSRMSTSSQGETNPVDTNSTPEGKANNRRVEFRKV